MKYKVPHSNTFHLFVYHSPHYIYISFYFPQKNCWWDTQNIKFTILITFKIYVIKCSQYMQPLSSSISRALFGLQNQNLVFIFKKFLVLSFPFPPFYFVSMNLTTLVPHKSRVMQYLFFCDQNLLRISALDQRIRILRNLKNIPVLKLQQQRF